MHQAFRGRSLDRRTFLRGAGAAVALPWLDAMVPALTRAPLPNAKCVFVFAPNGVNVSRWRPRGEGADTVLQGTLEPLVPLRERITVFSGLAIDGGWAHGDGPGDHARAAASFLTCAHPRKTGGADLQAGVSIDQVIASRIGSGTPFASLELGMDRGAAAGICDSGYSCAYSNNISWRTPNTPVAKETQPRALFARLFGDPFEDAAAARQQRQQDLRVIDAVLGDAKALSGSLGSSDRQKLEQYLQSVRELEQRLERGDDEEPDVPVPDGLRAAREFPDKLETMYGLITLALTTERTRVVTFMLGNAGSQRAYPWLGVPDAHHSLSHHGKKDEKLESIAKIDRFHVERFAAFLQRLSGEQAGDGDLLQQCLVSYGSGIGDGNRHNHDDLPVLLAGEGGGAARGRGHVRLPDRTPMANLYLAMQRAMGAPAESFADSTGELEIA
jgi:hypothetical protein